MSYVHRLDIAQCAFTFAKEAVPRNTRVRRAAARVLCRCIVQYLTSGSRVRISSQQSGHPPMWSSTERDYAPGVKLSLCLYTDMWAFDSSLSRAFQCFRYVSSFG